MKLNHIALRVKDLDASIRFYQELAALKILLQKEEFGAKLAYMGDSDAATKIELICIPGAETTETKQFFITFACDDLEERQALARDLGYQASDIRQPGDGTDYFYVYDPDGLSVQFRIVK